jgi:hypothetical protein
MLIKGREARKGRTMVAKPKAKAKAKAKPKAKAKAKAKETKPKHTKEELLKMLAASEDQAEKRRIRARLRTMGHSGGLGKKATPKKKVTPKAKAKPKK